MSKPLSPPTAALPPTRVVVGIFLAYASAYFLSSLLRAVIATLAPQLTRELSLSAGDLGLLGGAYFLGFSLMQLPVGSALDRYGPKRVQLVLLGVATLATLAFAQAQSLGHLVLARAAIGVGVASCLMAPLTCYRTLMSPEGQLRANSWMLMAGASGMLASTLPVAWMVPRYGWRAVFLVCAVLLLLSMLWIALAAPGKEAAPAAPASGSIASGASGPASAPAAATAASSYADIARHPLFRRVVPLGLLTYGGLVAVQTLWAAEWMRQVAGWSDVEVGQGLFTINLTMLFAFMFWGLAIPRLAARGWGPDRLLRTALPLALVVLGGMVLSGLPLGAGWLATWLALTSVVALIQPTVGQAFSAGSAGRALSAFNLSIFIGVFVLQWGLGVVIDLLKQGGASPPDAVRWAFGVLAVLQALALLAYWRGGRASGAAGAG